MEKEPKQFADKALAAAVTAAYKEKAKADVKKHAKSIKQFKDAIMAAEEEKSATMAKIFSTTATSSGETDKPRGTKSSSNKPSVTRGLISVESSTLGQTVFPNNAAEMQKIYLTLIRHSPKISVRAFLQRFTTVAGYVVELPGVIHSIDATDNTKAVAPYEDSELANITKHAFSLKWQTQYDLGHKAPPTVEYLQNAMEKIEVAFPLQNANGSSKNRGKPGKMSSLNDKIPKKKSSHVKHVKPAGKSCALYKKFGDASATHNTNDCKKRYSKGNLTKGFKGRVDSETPPGTSKSYAQLFTETEKLKAKSKKLKKALKKSARKKRKYADSNSDSESDTSDSDSE
eukprot:scaffold66582_cov38-Cyclotella_meneghiniana.AAC.2